MNPLQIIPASGGALTCEARSQATTVAFALDPARPFFAIDLAPDQVRPLIEWLEKRAKSLPWPYCEDDPGWAVREANMTDDELFGDDLDDLDDLDDGGSQ